MRDFRDAKAMAQSLRAALLASGKTITVGESLELIAKAFGTADWNTLSAAIRNAAARPEEKSFAPPQAAGLPSSGALSFSDGLQMTLQRAFDLAEVHGSGQTSLDHLLLALSEDPDAVELMRGCRVDPTDLALELTSYLDSEGESVMDGVTAAGPTADLQRVVQRAVIQVQSKGRDVVTGSSVLIALMSEPDSHAAHCIRQRGLSRADAVNFMATRHF